MYEILTVDLALKLAVGLMLLTMPVSVIRIAGLDRPPVTFWIRGLAALLVGVAAGTAVFVLYPDARGAIGPAGLVAINLTGAAVMLGQLLFKVASPTRRGRVVILVMALVLLLLAFLEIAHL